MQDAIKAALFPGIEGSVGDEEIPVSTTASSDGSCSEKENPSPSQTSEAKVCAQLL